MQNKYMKLFNFVGFCYIKLLEIELFDHLTLFKQMTNI